MLILNRSNFIRSLFFSLGLSLLLTTLLVALASAQQSQVITDSLVSQSLNGRTMSISIYLPPSYDEGDTRYPVLYYLHGAAGDHTQWVSSGIQGAMDSMLKEGKVKEMIIVMPSAPKSWYANSSVMGNYADHITQDLVEFIDGKYRILAQRESRAIGGRSMGGNGAMDLAIKHPDVYAAVISHSGVLSWNRLRDSGGFFAEGKYKGTPLNENIALAYSPNPNNSSKYDWPWGVRGVKGDLVEDVWQRWLEHDPVTMVKTHPEDVRQLAIYFDHGTADDVLPVEMARDFDRALAEAGIPHVYEEHNGGHGSAFPSRPAFGIPFLADALSWEIVTSTSAVHPQGKVAAMWASLKVDVR